jgi:cytochrome c biogenesis protein CcmG/thiol:disulfide interchange protein DsbE
MRRRLLAAALVATLASGSLAGCSLSSDRGTKAASTRLPSATLRPLGDGRTVDLSTLRGPMVINLWASWCKPCKEELPNYAAFATKYAGTVKVLGVDYQETHQDKAEAMARRAGVTYPLVSDPGEAFHAMGLPKLIMIDRHGEVVHTEYVIIKSVAQLERLVEKHLAVSPQ